jgi:hypothetical protein
VADVTAFFQSRVKRFHAIGRVIMALKAQCVAAKGQEGTVVSTVGVMTRITFSTPNRSMDVFTRGFTIVAPVAQFRECFPGHTSIGQCMGIVTVYAAFLQGTVGKFCSLCGIIVALHAQFVTLRQEYVRTVPGKIVAIRAIILYRWVDGPWDITFWRFPPGTCEGHEVPAPIDLDDVYPPLEEHRLAEGPVLVHHGDNTAPVKCDARDVVSIGGHTEDGNGGQFYRGLVGRIDDLAVSIGPALANNERYQQDHYTENS